MSNLLGLVVIVLVLVAIIGTTIKIYNRLIFLKFNTEKAFANIDVLLKQRADEIPNLITIVKEYVKHEKETLQELTELRTKYLNTNKSDEKVAINNNIAKAFGKIMMVAENYPDLKANNSFTLLQSRVSELEDNIADRREFFNESVNMYNIGVHEFPNVILAKFLNYNTKILLEISDTEKKYNGITF